MSESENSMASPAPDATGENANTHTGRAVKLAVLVAALGYFVDIYDLILFAMVRVPSLMSLGLSKAEAFSQGVFLLNVQMGGMLLGGLLWGIMADKRGRLSVLYGSILLYSLANLANVYVSSVPQYAVLRFIAGIGLAGELGAGITLVSETMGREKRGYGTSIVAAVGICGALLAGFVALKFDWRAAYGFGGVMGLALLALRVGVRESGMFRAVEGTTHARGDFLWLLRSGERVRRYLACIFIGLPLWYVVGVLVTMSPELGIALHMPVPPPNAIVPIMYCYAGLVIGDIGSGLISQQLRSRRKAVLIFVLGTAALIVVYGCARGVSLAFFHGLCFALGLCSGYWAMFVTIGSEQFGTNIRATVATTIPNFVRGAVIPFTLFVESQKNGIGILPAALIAGAVAVTIALAALAVLPETFGKDLDYIEV